MWPPGELSLGEASALLARPVVVGWRFISSQHLKSFQDGHQIVTMHTHGDFTVLSYWEIRPPVPYPISHSVILS